jgi:DNA-binding IclR family transcriptional regulator
MARTPGEPPGPHPTSARRVQAVEHAIDVLDAIAASGPALGVSDIARQTGLSKPTIHHLLATLEGRRFVIREPDTSRYRLSWALYELGSNVVRSLNLSRIARPYLDRLSAQTRESTLLGILDEDSVLYLDRGEPPAGLEMVADAGRRGSLHATASGKVLLAHVPKDQLDRLLDRRLPSYTKTTITDPAAMRRQLAQVRNRGYATCWEEREPGLCSLAVPLRDYTGSVAATLTLAGPADRLNSRSYQAHLAPLRAAAHRIELHLGGTRELERAKSVARQGSRSD